MNRLARIILLVIIALTATTTTATAAQWVPPKRLPWYWQLTGTIRMDKPAAVYDIDGFDTPAATVAALHNRGVKVIAYFSAGSWENWRPDAASFPASVKGRNLDGWAGEKWLDIRQLDVLRPIMLRRFQQAAAKGFDAIEPDNIDGYTNSTGFPLTSSHQLAYNRMLAELAHSVGLAVFQKNDVDQVAALQPVFDGAIVEECARYRECGPFGAYLSAGKPVLEAEYGRTRSAWTSSARAAGRMLAYYNLALDGRRWVPTW